MATVYVAGFDYLTSAMLIAEATSQSNSSASGGSPFGSGQSLTIGNASGTCNYTRANSFSPGISDVWVGFHYRWDTNNGAIVFYLLEGGTGHIRLHLSGGVLQVTRNGTALTGGAGSTPLSSGTWYYIRLHAVIHDSAGEFQLWLNENLECSGSGVDTRNGGTAGLINGWQLGGTNGNQRSYMDDLRIDDAPFSGVSRIITLRPDGAGSSTDFAPSAGSNFENVDDATANDDTDYNYSGNAGDKDLFTLGDLPGPGLVEAVQIVNRARRDDAGGWNIRNLLKTGSHEEQGSSIAVGAAYDVQRTLLATNPDTGQPWTTSEVNALEIGYENV